MTVHFHYGKRLTDADGLLVRFISRTELIGSGDGTPGVHPQIDAALQDYHERGLFRAEPLEVQIIPTLGLVPDCTHAVFVGIGAAPHDAAGLREAAAAAARTAKRLKTRAITVLLDASLYAGSVGCTAAETAQALAEGFLLGSHVRKSERREKPAQAAEPLQVAFDAAPAGEGPDPAGYAADWEEGVRRGTVIGEAVRFARDLTNLPGNRLTPELLALEAEAMAHGCGLEIEVIDEWSAAEMGMGGLIGVGQGSAHPPRMIVLHYEGAPDDQEVWGIVGKGITFDTGGISLKRSAGMEEQIADMAGAAAVLGAMRIVGELKPAVNVVAVIPAAENMPSDRSLKPGDVLTTMSGRTVEVVNTDAEGRLVLADGLTTAVRRGATRIVDVATLTGAVTAALGDAATAAVSNDDTFLQTVIRAGHRAGERIWPLPSYPEYRKLLDSDAADLKNSGGRHAATITGGLFVGVFAEELPWVHLDIAGTAWLKKERGSESKGASGVMTRTLAELLLGES